MELRHLRYFVAVAEELHFRRAAERLCIAQPPLSQQIQALETELGARLLTRSRRGVSLTETGRVFLLRARSILAEADAASEEARRMALGEVGELRVAYTASLPLTDMFPSILASFSRACPEVTVRLQEMFTLSQFEALRTDSLDVGFLRYYASEANVEGLHLRLLRRDPLVMVLPVDHPLADAGRLYLSQFASERFIVYPESSGADLAGLVRRLSHTAGFTLQVGQEAAEAVTQIGLVAAGLGVTVMPAPMACVAMDRVRYVPLADKGAFHTMYLVTRAVTPKPQLARFLECAGEAMGHAL